MIFRFELNLNEKGSDSVALYRNYPFIVLLVRYWYRCRQVPILLLTYGTDVLGIFKESYCYGTLYTITGCIVQLCFSLCKWQHSRYRIRLLYNLATPAVINYVNEFKAAFCVSKLDPSHSNFREVPVPKFVSQGPIALHYFGRTFWIQLGRVTVPKYQYLYLPVICMA
jgi:hypothetical protein